MSKDNKRGLFGFGAKSNQKATEEDGIFGDSDDFVVVVERKIPDKVIEDTTIETAKIEQEESLSNLEQDYNGDLVAENITEEESLVQIEEPDIQVNQDISSSFKQEEKEQDVSVTSGVTNVNSEEIIASTEKTISNEPKDKVSSLMSSIKNASPFLKKSDSEAEPEKATEQKEETGKKLGSIFSKGLSGLDKLADGVKKKVSETVNEIENKVENGFEKESKEDFEEEINKRLSSFNQKIKHLENTIETLEKEISNGATTQVSLPENIKMEDVVKYLLESSKFTKEVAYYAKNELSNVAEIYLSENLDSLIGKIKKVGLESLNAENQYRIKMSDLEEKLGLVKKNIVISEKTLEEKQQSIKELEKQIENETKTLENIEKETNSQNEALKALRQNVSLEEKRILEDLKAFEEREKQSIDQSLEAYKQNAKGEIEDRIKTELAVQIDKTTDQIKDLLETIPENLKASILEKLLNK